MAQIEEETRAKIKQDQESREEVKEPAKWRFPDDEPDPDVYCNHPIFNQQKLVRKQVEEKKTNMH